MTVLINMALVFLSVYNTNQVLYFYNLLAHYLMVLIFVVIAGIAMLLGAGFFGYMLALLQRRVGTIVSSQNVSTLLCYDSQHLDVKLALFSLLRYLM